MIHYIDGKPSKNVHMNKPKRHAVAHYRHTQRIATLTDILTRFAIVLTVGTILTAIYLIKH